MARIRKEISTYYDVEIVGKEDYKIIHKSFGKCVEYDAQGNRILEVFTDYDRDEYNSVVFYEDGLPHHKIRAGVQIGQYTYEKISEDENALNYTGDDYNFTEIHKGEKYVFKREEHDNDVYEFLYEYDDNKCLISRRSYIKSYDIETGSFYVSSSIDELIYKDGKLQKMICYDCEPLNAEERHDWDYIENGVKYAREYHEIEEQVGDERVVVVREYEMPENNLLIKTINVYDLDNNILRKTEVSYMGSLVEETIYEYCKD